MKYLVGVTLGLMLIPSQLASQTPHRPVGIKRPDVVQRWRQTMWKGERNLQAGEWKKARRLAQSVLSEMFDRIEGGEGVANLFAAATFLRAVSEAGLGNEDAASWDYTVAQTLLPELTRADMSSYGAAGKLLEPWRRSGKAAEKSIWREFLTIKLPDTGSGQQDDTSTLGKVVPPKKIIAPKPRYPFGKYEACIEGPVLLQIIIDERGIPRRPLLLTDQEPLLGYAAMEAVRDWRFEPARLDGEPIGVYYNLPVNFRLRRCFNLFAEAKENPDGG